MCAQPIPWPSVIDYSVQSKAVAGTRRPGQTAHYRNALFGLIDINTPNALQTLTQIFDLGLQASRDKPCLGHRPLVSQSPVKYASSFVWETYAQVDERRRDIGSAITTLFNNNELRGSGDLETVGIWSSNRPEWQIIDLAMQAYDKVAVSLYDTLGDDSVEYIINHAELSVIFASSQHIPTLLKSAASLPTLKMIVSIDTLSPQTKHILSAWGDQHDIQIKELAEIEAFGRENLQEPIVATPDTVATICYTSGTTGNPKGVILTHGNLAMSVQSAFYGFETPPVSILLSYLPLAHIYERASELTILALGGQIGYFTGDPLRLLEDAQVLKPTFFPAVPRVLNRIYQAAMVASTAGGLKAALFNKAIDVKLRVLHETGVNTHAFWDRLVFRKIQAVLGGRVFIIPCGSAPMNVDVLDFLKIALACRVIEGYGMTENCGTSARCWPGDPSSSGSIGAPQPVNEMKIVDVPAMGYSSEDLPNPRGELCIRGVNCFKEYYKDEQNTRETVDEEDWVHSGDVVELDGSGRFKIIDRVKNIMKLAQGEYVALEKIENTYTTCPIIAQIYVHGSALEAYLLAVVVPDPVQLTSVISHVHGKNVSPQDVSALKTFGVNDPKVNQHILEALTKEAKRAGLRGFETVKRIHLSLEPFTVEDGSMTPTFKLKRAQAYAKFKRELDELYELAEPFSSSSKL